MVEDAPSSVSIIIGRELRAMAYPTIAEAVRGVRGVFLTDDTSSSRSRACRQNPLPHGEFEAS